MTANGSVETDQNFPITISTGFFNQDVPADPTQDEMWFPSLRFVTLAPASWTNFGSTAAIPLQKGSHTIYWKVWVTSATLKSDSGTLLIEAFPQKAATPGPGPARVLPQNATLKASDRPSMTPKATDGGGKLKLCCSEPFDALLSVIAKTDDKPELRIGAIKSASDLARLDQAACEKLGKALSIVIANSEDDADVRRAAIDAIKNLVQ